MINRGMLHIKANIVVLLGFVMLVFFCSCGNKLETAKSENETEFQAYYEPITSADIATEGDVHYASSQILLTASSDATYKDIEKMIAKSNGEIIGYISATGDYQIRFLKTMDFVELEKLVEKFKNDNLVEDASLAYVAQFESDAVNYMNDPWIDADDPSDKSGSVWDEENPEGKNWWVEAIDMPSVWNMNLSFQTVKVGIIDTMFDITNEDLNENLFAKTWNNPLNEEGICNVTQLYNSAAEAYEQAVLNGNQTAIDNAENRLTNASHGTHVAGIIAAEANNGFGIAGINQNVELYGYSVLSDEAVISNENQWGSIFQIECAIAHLLNEGVKVINISMGSDKAIMGTQDGDSYWCTFTTVSSKSLESFLLKYIEAGNEFLIVKSAGNNSSTDKKYDAQYDIFGAIANEQVSQRIIIVGAAKYNTKYGFYSIADFSNTGSRVDVYAPGVDILSTIPSNVTKLESGTSMAAPVVTGLASLMWGINPNLSAEQVRSFILTSTSATIFDLDDKSVIIRDLIEWQTDSTAIVNADICVQLAQATTGNGHAFSSEYGTISGVVYARTSDGTDVIDIDIQSLSLYNENKELVSTIPVQDIAYHKKDKSTGEASIINLSSYFSLVEPGTYFIKVENDEYETQERQVTVKPNDVNRVDFELVSLNNDELNIFDRLPSEFLFSSGAGGWGTVLKIESDGTFYGQYSDSDMGDFGAGYSNGTEYICHFNGKFTQPEKINEYSYSMNLESLNVEGTSGTVYYESDTRYIVSDPYGMDNADEFYIYLPGAPIAELPDGFLSWAHLNSDIRDTLPAGFYGIYNVGGEQGFIGMDDNNLWNASYTYDYEDYTSTLRPSYSNVSHLTFRPEDGAATMILEFSWSNDEQREFDAYDANGSGDYHISLDISDDLSIVRVSLVSVDGTDLSAWGGTTDGKLVAEYIKE